ncbi:TIM-barrel domain-containing protein [Sanguibacter biliveldensis]|uniref:TIM-barrel domain-containing protein n=1 Tax=Sanguibacter biliveldensis TaxID=3030830 RepID=UPI0038CD90B4
MDRSGGGRAHDPASDELLVRWFQMGALMPVTRLHGDRGLSQEVRAADGSRRRNSRADYKLWSYADEVYGILSRCVPPCE